MRYAAPHLVEHCCALVSLLCWRRTIYLPKMLPKEAKPPGRAALGAGVWAAWAARAGTGAGEGADGSTSPRLAATLAPYRRCPLFCSPCEAPEPGADAVLSALPERGPRLPSLSRLRLAAAVGAWAARPGPRAGLALLATLNWSDENGLTSLRDLSPLGARRRDAALLPPRPGAGANAGGPALTAFPAAAEIRSR